MRDTSKFLSVLTVLGLLTLAGNFGLQPEVKHDLVQPVGVIEFAKIEDPTKFVGHGSGVFITPTRLLTAGHVIDDIVPGKSTATVRTEDGNIYHVVATKKSDDFDVGYVTVDRPYTGYIPSVSCEAQPRGAELINIGNPMFLEFVESKIMVAGGSPQNVAENTFDPVPVEPEGQKFKRHMPDDTPGPTPPKEEDGPPANLNGTVFFQGVALPGQSGSPIYTQDGKIVGVLVISVVNSQIGSFTGLGMYVQSSAICDFLQNAVKKS